jgi:TP901 family phage tail tape measure protein
MARSRNFNLTAEINLRGPANIRTVVANIRRQLGSINANVNVNVSAAASRSITGLNTRLRTLNGTLANTVTNVNNVTNAINALSTAMRGIPTPPTIIPPGLPAATRDVRAARTEMEEFGRQTGLAIRRFAAFSVGTAGIYALVNAARQGVESFISFNKEMIKLQQVTGESQTSLKKVSDEITTLSTSLGVASSELLNVATTLAQAGLSAKDTEKALKALALSSLAPSFDDMNSTVEGSIALMKQFGISAGDLEGALGSINSVAAKFAVEAGDIIAAIQRTGGVFASASRGVSEGTDALNEFIAVFTSVRATTRESAETIATGLRTIFTRIQRAGTIEALKDFGIVLTDAEGKFVGAYKAIELLSQGLNKLDPRNLKFSEIVEELGGFRQIGKVIPLIQQFATAQQALLVAQKGSGSLAEDAATAQLSLANQIAKVREEFFALFREIGGSDSFQVMAKATLELASGLIKVADAAKGVLPIVGTILALRGLQGAGQFIGGFRGGLGRRGAANGGIIRYNKGGTVPAMVSNGEAFVPPETVRRIGVGKLKRMNQADRNKSGRYAGGGGIRVFKGPGSGTSDSIGPIGLPAGSFIIREKATKALGYNNGGYIQKFASGTKQPIRQKMSIEDRILQGMSRTNARGETKYHFGVAALRPGSGSEDSQSNKKPRISQSFRQPFTIPGNKAKGIPPRTGRFHIGTLSTIGLDNQIETILKTGFENSVNSATNTLAQKMPGKVNIVSLKGQLNRIYKGSGFQQVIGSGLEAAVAKLGSPYIDKTEKTKVFDFPMGLGPASKLFGSLPSNIPTDATRTIGGFGKGLSKLKDSAARLMDAIDNKEFTKARMDKIREYQKQKKLRTSVPITTNESSLLSSIFDDLGSGTVAGGADLRAKYGFKKLTRKQVMETLPQLPELERQKFLQEFRKAVPVRRRAAFGGLIQSFPMGGMPKGRGVKGPRGSRSTLKELSEAEISQLSTADLIKYAKAQARDVFSTRGAGMVTRMDFVPVPKERIVPELESSLITYLGQKGFWQEKISPFGRVSESKNKKAQLKTSKESSLKSQQARMSDEVAARSQEWSSIRAGSSVDNYLLKSLKEPVLSDYIKAKSGQQLGKAFHDTRLRQSVNKALDKFDDFDYSPTNLDKLISGIASKNFASGGEIPIMAQRGEYVINKQSAQSIGYNNLHKLNKYHTGGVVGQGAVQSFAGGGLVGGLGRILSQLNDTIRRFTTRIARVPSGGGWLGGSSIPGIPATGTGPRAAARGRTPGRIPDDNMRTSPASNAAFALSFALPVINEMFSGSEEPTNAGQASSKAFSGSLTTGLGGALAIGSMGGPLGIIGGLAVAAGSIVKAFADAENAVREFNIKDAGDKLNNQLELTNKSLDKFGNNLNDAGIRTKALEDVLSSITKAQAVTTASESRKVGVFNLLDTGGGTAEGQLDAFRRSVVLFDQGIGAYLNTLSGVSGQANTSAAFAKSIPKMAKERATGFGGASQSTTALLETEIKRTGSLDALKANAEEFKKLTSSLALADVQIQEQILGIQNNNNLNAEQKKTIIAEITARAGEAKAIEISNRAMREKAIDELNKAANKAAFSLELMFTEMEQSINASNFAIDKLKESSDLAAASLSGQAKIGQTRLNAINVLQNPRAYSSRENNEAASLGASAFGSDLEPAIKGLLRFGPMLQDTVMSTINQVLTTTPKEELNNEVIASKISRAVRQSLDRLQLPPELASKLSNEVGKNIEELRKSGQDKVDFSELAERIPALSKVVESAKRAQETAIQALENWQKSLNTYSEAFNTITSLQIQNNERLRRSSDILYQGQLELGKAFGKSTDLRGAINNFNATVGSMSGGLTAVGDIAQEIQRLERVRQQQQNLQNDAANRGIEGAQDFMLMTKNLKDTNIKLRESYSALELLSNSSEVAAAAMSKIAELQQKQQAGIGIMEKIVTSTPEELANFGNALQRLQVNMMGGVNIGSTSEQRGETLQAFNMIAPLLGDAQGALRANVLEGMLREVNAPLTPFFSNILESLRNPDADPQMKEAIDIYKQSLDQQVIANAALNRLNETTIKEGADFAAKQIVQGLQGTLQTFQNRQLENIAKGISDLAQIFRERLPMAAPAVGRALGGIIYADGGAFVPRGTDTVPAMLTPGEFVVNRRATQKNLPLLKSINSGSNGYSRGGTVYLAGGGEVLKVFNPAMPDKPVSTDSLAVFPYQTKENFYDIPLNSSKKLQNNMIDVFAVKPVFYASATDAKKPPLIYNQEAWTDDSIASKNRLSSMSINARMGTKSPSSIVLEKNTTNQYPYNSVFAEQSKNFNIPSLDAINTLNESPQKPLKGFSKELLENKILLYKEEYKNIYNLLSAFQQKDNYVEFNKFRMFSKLNKPTIAPSLVEYGDSAELLNIAEKSKEYLGPITQAEYYSATNPISSKNPIGFATYSTMVTGPTPGRFALTSGYENIGSGFNPFTGEGVPFGADMYSGIDLEDSIGKGTNANLFQSMDISAKVKGKIKESLDALNRNSDIVESEEQLLAKKIQKELSGLINKTLFKSTLSLLDNSKRINTTLYNIDDQNIFNDLIKTYGEQRGQSIETTQYSGNKNEWLNIGKDSKNIKGNFPWTKNIEPIPDEILKSSIEKFTKQNNLIKSKSQQYTNKDMSFLYRETEGPFFNSDSGLFEKKQEKFIVVPLGGDKPSYAQNPFAENDFGDNRFAYYQNIAELDAIIDKALVETSNPISTKQIDTKSIRRVSSLIGDYDPMTRDNAFTNNDILPGKLKIEKFIEEYNKSKNIKEIGRQFRVPGAGTADNNLLSALKTPKSLLDITSKTIRDPKIARIGGALKYPLFGLSRPEQLKNYVQYLNTISTNLGTDRRAGKLNRDNSVTFNENFAELYGMLIASKDFFSALDASDTGKISNIIGADISGFVQGNNIAQGGMDRIIQSIKNRAGGIKSTVLSGSAFKGILGQSTNAFEDLIKKDPEAVDIAEIDPATGAVIGYKKPTTQTANKTIEQVGAVALNPYNFFKDDSRKNLINDSIISAINSSLTEYNSRKVKPKDLLNRTYGIKNDVTILRDWFSDIHDKIMNVKIDDKTIEDMGAGGINNLKTQIEAGLNGGNLDDLASRRFDLSQKALSRLTFGSYVLGKGGTPTPLLDFNGILDLLIARKGIKMTSPAAAAVAGTPAAGAPAAGTPAVGKALGGLIYASNGTLVNFTPRGTDTVPAMLTPGEFVVNRQATQKNLPLLKSINSGNYATGGIVNNNSSSLDSQNFQDGGKVFEKRKFISADRAYSLIGRLTDVTKQDVEILGENGRLHTIALNKLDNLDKQYAMDNYKYFKDKRGIALTKAVNSIKNAKSIGRIDIDSKEPFAFTDKAGEWAVNGKLMSADDISLNIERLTKGKKEGKPGEIIRLPKSILDAKSMKFADSLIEMRKATTNERAKKDKEYADSLIQPIKMEDIIPNSGISIEEKNKNDSMISSIMDNMINEWKYFSTTPEDMGSRVIIDPVTQIPKTIAGEDINVKALYKSLEEATYQTRLPPTATSSMLGPIINNLKSWISEIEEEKIMFRQKRDLKNKETQTRFEDLEKQYKTNTLKPIDILEYDMLSIERGRKGFDLINGSAAERSLRDEGFGVRGRQKLEKTELEKFKKELSKERATSMFEKVAKEAASYTGPFAPLTEFLLNLVSPENIVTDIGIGGIFKALGPSLFNTLSKSGVAQFVSQKALSGIDTFMKLPIGNTILDYASKFKQSIIDVALGAKDNTKTIFGNTWKSIKEAIENADNLMKGSKTSTAKSGTQTTQRSTEELANRAAKTAKEVETIVAGQGMKALSPELQAVVAKLSNSKSTIYDIFGLDPSAAIDPKLLGDRYRQLSKLHPDITAKQGLDPKYFKTVQLMFERIKDSKFKKLYDEYLSAGIDTSTLMDSWKDVSRTFDLRRIKNRYPSFNPGTPKPKTPVGPSAPRPRPQPKEIQEVNSLFKKYYAQIPPGSTVDYKSLVAANLFDSINLLKGSPAWRTVKASDQERVTQLLAQILKEQNFAQFTPSASDTIKSGWAQLIEASGKVSNLSGRIRLQDLELVSPGLRSTLRPDDLIRPAIYKPKPKGTAQTKSNGGIIYASGGQYIDFKSKGTDTVPAMLTPGEFVVNRKATQENLPLLKSINSGQSVGGHYAIGGMVNSKTPTLDQNVLNKNNQKIQYKLVNIDKSIGVIDERTKKIVTYLDPNKQEAQLRSSGGIIYASEGQLIDFQPKGTDTVPAMLTPGEFVVNRKATQKNLPLLKSINNGANGYSRGGVVYLARGGPTDPEKQLKQQGSKVRDSFFQESLSTLAKKWLVTTKDKPVSLMDKTGLRAWDVYNAGNPKYTPGTLIYSILNPDTNFASVDGFNLNNAYLLSRQRYDWFDTDMKKPNEKNRKYKIISAAAVVRELMKKAKKTKPSNVPEDPNDPGKVDLGGGKDTLFLDLITREFLNAPRLFEAKNPDLFDPTGGPTAEFLNFVKDPIKQKQIYTELTDRLNWLKLIQENGIIAFNNLNKEKARPANSEANIQDHYQAAINLINSNLFPASGLSEEINKVDALLKDPNIFTNRNNFSRPNRFANSRFFAYNDPAIDNSYKNVTQVKKYNRGGMVYAANGQYINAKPIGTDTVPAMLTPGEFVVNRKATQENFALLKSINDGAKASTYSRGGPVYLEDGGITPNNKPRNQNSTQSNNISSEAQKFLTTFSSKIDSFGKYVQDLSNIKLPNKIEINIVAQPIEVRITGAAALEGMSEGIRNMVVSEVNQKMSKIWGQTDGAIGNNPATAQR